MGAFCWRACHITVLTVCILVWFPVQSVAEKLVIALLDQQTEPYQNVLEGFRKSLKKQGIEMEYEVLNFDAEKDQEGKVLQSIKTKAPALVFTLGSTTTECAHEVSGLDFQNQPLNSWWFNRFQPLPVKHVYILETVERRLCLLKRIIG